MEKLKIEMKEIHSKLLELMIVFDEFCIKNDITYYLMGGSALGAMRHQGFIPWDDDIDVFMTYENYERFKNICKEKLEKDKFYFQEGNTKELPSYFSKFRMNNTTFIEGENKDKTDMHQGFFIDIMCLYNASSNIVNRYIQYGAAAILKTRALADMGYQGKVWWKRVLLNISKVLVNKYTKVVLMKIVNRYKGKNTELVGHFFGRARFRKTSFPKTFLGTPRYVRFENVKLPVPERVEEYLTVRFGENHMEMPSEKTKGQYPSHAYIVDPYNNYTKYI